MHFGNFCWSARQFMENGSSMFVYLRNQGKPQKQNWIPYFLLRACHVWFIFTLYISLPSFEIKSWLTNRIFWRPYPFVEWIVFVNQIQSTLDYLNLCSLESWYSEGFFWESNLWTTIESLVQLLTSPLQISGTKYLNLAFLYGCIVVILDHFHMSYHIWYPE